MSKTEPPKKDSVTEIHEGIGEFLKACTGPASPLVSLIWPSFHQKRVEKWRNEVHLKIEELSDIHEQFTIKSLQENPEFTSILIQSTQIATRNFQEEKLIFLKNIIINTPSSYLKSDLKLTFLNFVDELSVSQIQLLSILNEKIGEIQILPSLPQIYNYLVENNSVEWTKHEFRLFISGLQTRGLIRLSDDIDDFAGEVTTTTLFSIGQEEATTERFIMVLETGEMFLDFILNQNID